MTIYKMLRFSLLVFSSILLVNAQVQIEPKLVNKNVERTIDLTSHLVKLTATITLENTGSSPISNYLVVLEPETAGNLSFISVKDALKEELKIKAVVVAGHKDKVFYNVQLKQPLGASRTAVIFLESVLTGALVPYPSEIAQKDKQLVRYFGSHYFYTPYQTNKQTTAVTLSSRNIENHTKLKPVSQSDSTINYGPYTDIAPFSFDEMSIHYENNSPFLTVTRLYRLIEISHWGNIAVEENIDVVHSGAKLKGPFSRYDYQRDTSSNHHSIKSYKTILPAAAYNIYYRDSNGNISTSTVRPRKDYIELELRPRFPLFGGWKSSYTLGYNVPSYQYLYKKGGNEYVLSMRLLDHIYDDMHVEELQTDVVLPVGVQNVKLSTPYDVHRLEDGKTYKYLDNLGRVVIRLKKTNLVEQHIQDLEITYQWDTITLIHEPILLALALFALFIIVIIYVRLDFSIHKSEKKE
ncbi:dolichyl-diphosphooligosaccharide--protein glycosyltransferase subunit 1 [Coccinella septempunctata]|uniref:dolichyl-diphosphooligosaccharide--protein glycosyltransferase subunit 1 n=1 Tax=Coccinella septempunctata TaxID=41139 RepID=UPI001D095BAE|nr:dolichyl-diphosphooligosaccharide--protein glycosyltransferase subunit 1 [Coccinella septempunctata]